jgi:heme A synthase
MKRAWLHSFAVAGAIAAFAAVGAGAARPWGTGPAIAFHLLFAVMMVATVRTSRAWAGPALPFPDGGFPSLRALAWITPAAVLLQIALGAAYRNELLGLIPHVSWAFLTAILALVLALFVLTQEARHAPLRLWAIILLCATGAQVLLGVLAFVARLNPGSAGPFTGAIHAHVGTGTLVLGVSAAMSAWILRDAVPASASSNSSDPLESGRHS